MASEVHHGKAQLLLQQIDLAKRQRGSNEDARSLMLDSEDHLLHLYQNMYVQRMHHDVNVALEDARQRLLEYENKLSYSQSTKRLEAARFVQDCKLEATQEMLTNEDAVCSLRAIDAAVSHMNRILAEYPDGDPHLRRYIMGALDVLNRAGRLVQAARIESDGWLPVLGPVLQALEQLVRCRPIEEPLSELVDEIQRLSEADRALQAQQREAAEAGETLRGEELTRDRIMALEGIADLVTHKFRVISHIDEGTLSVLQRETARIRGATIENARDLLRQTEAKREVLSEDLHKIRDQKAKADRDQTLARSAFMEAKAASDQLLARNANQQNECWQKLLELERQLRELAVERRDEVDKRTRMVEREERRRCDMRYFAEFADEHEGVLQNSLSSCEAEEELGQMMQEIVLQACQAVDAKVHSMQRSLENTRMAAFAEHSERFREQYLHLGDVMYRKERHIDELDRRIDMLNLQQDLAMQTFNPKAKYLSEQRAELEVERAGVQSFLGTLQQKASTYVESFKPTEKALRAVSNAFVHPVFELQKNNKARSRKLDQYYAATVHAAEMGDIAKQQGIDPKLTWLPKEIEAEREDIAAKSAEPPLRRFVGRDGERPKIDLSKPSDFNPLGSNRIVDGVVSKNDGIAGARRPPRTIKTKLQEAIASGGHSSPVDASQSASPTAAASAGGGGSPERFGDRVLRGGLGLVESLEPAGGRALSQLKMSSDAAEVD